MDLHLMSRRPPRTSAPRSTRCSARPTSGWHGGERDEVTHRVARGGRAARDQRHLLLPALHALQARVGWISQGGLNYVSERLTVPPAEAYGVATFYAMFTIQPRAAAVVHACDDLRAASSGGEQVCDALEERFGPPGRRRRRRSHGSAARASACASARRRPSCSARAGRRRTWRSARSAAAGQHLVHRDARAAGVRRVPTDPQASSAPQTLGRRRARPALRLLRRVGVVDPASIDDYRAHGGYEALRRALELGPED